MDPEDQQRPDDDGAECQGQRLGESTQRGVASGGDPYETESNQADAPQDECEEISYKIPTLKYRGRALLYVASHKDHCSVYPVTDAMLEAGGDEIARR